MPILVTVMNYGHPSFDAYLDAIENCLKDNNCVYLGQRKKNFLFIQMDVVAEERKGEILAKVGSMVEGYRQMGLTAKTYLVPFNPGETGPLNSQEPKWHDYFFYPKIEVNSKSLMFYTALAEFLRGESEITLDSRTITQINDGWEKDDMQVRRDLSDSYIKNLSGDWDTEGRTEVDSPDTYRGREYEYMDSLDIECEVSKKEDKITIKGLTREGRKKVMKFFEPLKGIA